MLNLASDDAIADATAASWASPPRVGPARSRRARDLWVGEAVGSGCQCRVRWRVSDLIMGGVMSTSDRRSYISRVLSGERDPSWVQPKVTNPPAFTMSTGAGKTHTMAPTLLRTLPGHSRPLVVPHARVIDGKQTVSNLIAAGLLSVDSYAGSPAQSATSGYQPLPYQPRKMRVRQKRGAAYRALCERVMARKHAGLHEQRSPIHGDRRTRDRYARQAVLHRCNRRCENPDCLLPRGEMLYITDSGEPLLHVDHIDDHAAGGLDEPSAMIALCATCHDNKTRGSGRAELKERLRAVAWELHEGLYAE